MIGIDTNILVRYLTQDDKTQSKIATSIMESEVNNEQGIFINNIVICELIWVLESGYKYSKSQVISVIKEILTTIEFEFENHEVLWLSQAEYEKSAADFSDILIGKLNTINGCSYTYSFDNKAVKLHEFKLP